MGKLFGRGRSARSGNLARPRRVLRAAVVFAVAAGLFGWLPDPLGATQKDEKKDAKTPAKEPLKDAGKLTPAAEETFAKLLKAKVSAEFKEARLGDVLKEFAHQVETKTDVPVLWAYG